MDFITGEKCDDDVLTAYAYIAPLAFYYNQIFFVGCYRTSAYYANVIIGTDQFTGIYQNSVTAHFFTSLLLHSYESLFSNMLK